jgi:phosphinothricin acetyltransferase
MDHSIDRATGGVTVEAMTAADWPAVEAIYAQGIATGNATFDTTSPTWEAWDAAHLPEHRLVARSRPLDGKVLGWGALAPVSGRCVYAGVAENSIYIDEAARGRGVGRRLLQALLASSERAGIWTVQSGIFPENEASLALHRSCGFRIVGTHERLGRDAAGRWRDVVLLERRSPAIR